MMANEPIKEVASISDVARMVGLSRGRFYQLVCEGVFPQPNRSPETGRPFYDRHQQETCLHVRRTNCGINGRPILFYSCRRDVSGEIVRGGDRSRRSSRKSPENAFLKDLRDGLTRLGITSASDSAIMLAIERCFPEGCEGNDLPTILTAVFRHLTAPGSDG